MEIGTRTDVQMLVAKGSDRMNGYRDTDRCTDVSSELDRMNGNWDTDKCTDVSSEGSDKRVRIICIDYPAKS